MTKQLFIPDKIKVGYQEREGTYTGKLAYVIYYDKKGKLRKETSWRSWCDLPDSPRIRDGGGIEPHEFENVPTEGFVLNKGVGGQRYSYGWNARNEYIRAYDPRDFEFEISVANLIYILSVGDCTRGKGLEGEFVYSWNGTELVLLPVTSTDYQNCQAFSSLQDGKVSARALVGGREYESKTQVKYIYIGRLRSLEQIDRWSKADVDKVKKKFHIFYNVEGKRYKAFKSMTSLARCSNEECHPEFAELLENYEVSSKNILIDRICLEDSEVGNGKYIEHDGEIYSCNMCENLDPYWGFRSVYDKDTKYDKTEHFFVAQAKAELVDGVVVFRDSNLVFVGDDTVAKKISKSNVERRRHGYHSNREGYTVVRKEIDFDRDVKSLIAYIDDGKRFAHNSHFVLEKKYERSR